MSTRLEQIAFEAIGTHWQITLPQVPMGFDVVALFKQVQDRIEQFEDTYSRFRPQSLLTKIAQQAGEYQLPTDAEPLFSLYQKLYHATKGAFTPLIGQALVDAGYDSEYSLQPKSLKQIVPWEEALTYDFPKLTTKHPIALDFGAAGKGYIIDIVSKLIQETGINDFLINAGGDIYHHSSHNEPITVGLEHPHNKAQVIGIAQIYNQSICGSAGNRRQWEGFHHIINPHNLQSPRHIEALWVIANETMIADALATCLFFVSVISLAKDYNFEYLIMYSDSSIERSPHFPAELFIRE
ncbi:FAD:protein FMN transferase [Candidatus Gracilibacteria bacterium]|nr:FAD:protein FMN transferase [Candidatus Gracilibacteria bacterium]